MGRQPIGGRPVTTILRQPSWNDSRYKGRKVVVATASRCKTDPCFHIIIRQFRIQKWRNKFLYPQPRGQHISYEFSIAEPSSTNMAKKIFAIWKIIGLENGGNEVVISSIHCRITNMRMAGNDQGILGFKALPGLLRNSSKIMWNDRAAMRF